MVYSPGGQYTFFGPTKLYKKAVLNSNNQVKELVPVFFTETEGGLYQASDIEWEWETEKVLEPVPDTKKDKPKKKAVNDEVKQISPTEGTSSGSKDKEKNPPIDKGA